MNQKIYFSWLTDASLATTAKRVVENAQIDINHLSPLGISELLLTDILAKAQELENDPKHSYFRGEITKQTELKLEKSKVLKQTMRQIKSQILFVSFTDVAQASVVLKAFRTKKPVLILEQARLMLHTLQAEPQDLSLYGVTDQVLALLESQINDLAASLVSQEFKIVGLPEHTQARNQLRADLSKMLKRVSTVGRTYWQIKKSNKMKNYVIRKHTNSSPGVAGESTQSTPTQEAKTFSAVS